MNVEEFNSNRESLDASWCAEMRTKLDREAGALDSVTAARLAAARHRALAVAQEKSRAHGWPWLGSAIAASLLLAVVWVRAPEDTMRAATTKVSTPAAPVATAASTQAAPAPGGTYTTSPRLMVDGDVAVIADLEFYDWLEEQDALL